MKNTTTFRFRFRSTLMWLSKFLYRSKTEPMFNTCFVVLSLIESSWALVSILTFLGPKIGHLPPPEKRLKWKNAQSFLFLYVLYLQSLWHKTPKSHHVWGKKTQHIIYNVRTRETHLKTSMPTFSTKKTGGREKMKPSTLNMKGVYLTPLYNLDLSFLSVLH